MSVEPLRCVFDDSSATLAVVGAVDELSVDVLLDALAESTRGYTRDVTVDLVRVTFLPSVGIGVLALAARQAAENGCAVTLVAAEGTIAQKVLAICGLPYETRPHPSQGRPAQSS